MKWNVRRIPVSRIHGIRRQILDRQVYQSRRMMVGYERCRSDLLEPAKVGCRMVTSSPDVIEVKVPR